MVYGKPKDDDLLVSVKVVYDKELFKDKDEKEIESIVWNDIKEINKTMPNYKHIKGLVVTDEEMVKTTTARVKRFEEMKKL